MADREWECRKCQGQIEPGKEAFFVGDAMRPTLKLPRFHIACAIDDDQYSDVEAVALSRRMLRSILGGRVV